jgi:hypothetical protein
VKVRVCYTVDVDDDFRRRLRAYFGQEGLATREEIREWYEQRGSQDDDDMLIEGEDKENR